MMISGVLKKTIGLLFAINALSHLISTSQCQDISFEWSPLLRYSNDYDIPFWGMYSICELEGHIQQIRDQDKTGTILLALDWDNTVSFHNGTELPLREGELTHTILNKLVTGLNVLPCILTSRFSGESPRKIFDKSKRTIGEAICETGELMRKAAPFLENTPILNEGFHMGHFDIREISPGDPLEFNYTDSVIVYKGIIFAGSSDHSVSQKGKTLAQLTDGQWMRTGKKEWTYVQLEYDHLIFVDNEIGHVISVAGAFQNHPKKKNVSLIYYPVWSSL